MDERNAREPEKDAVLGGIGLDEHALRAEAARDDRRRRRRAMIAGGAGLAVLIGLAAGATSLAADRGTVSSSASTVGGESVVQLPNGSAFGRGGADSDAASSGHGGAEVGGYGRQAADAVAASDAQKAGVVTILSDLGYESASSAGTGMILDADGMILTNNHVIEGATSIEVTVESTGESYAATVVGADARNDVAVLQLQDASGLTPVAFDTDGVSVGDAVTAVGNAEGRVIWWLRPELSSPSIRP